MKKYLTEKFWKGLGMYFYKEVLYKYAQEYVQKTENSYDDAALLFLDDMVQDFLSDSDDA